MDEVWQALRDELPSLSQAVLVGIRLVVAVILGGIIGLNRELMGKAAGLRTHMLVSLGACLFVLAPKIADPGSDLTRVIQGVATGIGFVGGGAILKMTESRTVRGLTTATGIWLTAALGLAVGLGPMWVPIMATAIAWLILTVMGKIESVFEPQPKEKA